ncbi:MAG TPA: TIGR03667 family PPOX class F420-dependent oxidoreductase [Actinomycetota bacterium]|nr:TIGR03667 family PPOX class F420-dependent oxidoreductase [Actinomycetota bacterium]
MVLDSSDSAHAAAEERLRSDIIIWLTTVRADGQPQSTPVWFLWEDGTFLIYSRPGMPKLENITANPKVSLHLRGTETGGDVVTFDGTAELLRDGPPADQVPEYVSKYREEMEGYSWTPAKFAELYSEPIRVTPTEARIWE